MTETTTLLSDRGRCDRCGDRLITETEHEDGLCAPCACWPTTMTETTEDTNQRTRCMNVPLRAPGEIAWRVDEFNAKMEKRNLPGRVAVNFDFDKKFLHNADRGPEYREWLVPCTMTIAGEFVLGEWKVIGAYDWRNDTAEPMRYGFPDGYKYPDTTKTRRCDHCETNRNRGLTFTVATPDGDEKIIGKTCMKDYTGHSPMSVLRWYEELDGMVDEWDEIMGDTSGSGRYPLVGIVAAAAAVIEANDGYVSWKNATEDREATKYVTIDTINGRPTGKHKDERIAVTEAHMEQAEAAIEWAQGIAATSDFERNLCTIAGAEWCHKKTVGFACYIPAAHQRALADEKAKAAEPEQKVPTPTSDGPHAIEGVVLKTVVVEENFSYYGGSSLKATIRDDRGFTVWGTVPSAAPSPGVGDRVRFVCSKIVRSDGDETFGFFKRPRRWETLTEAEEAA